MPWYSTTGTVGVNLFNKKLIIEFNWIFGVYEFPTNTARNIRYLSNSLTQLASVDRGATTRKGPQTPFSRKYARNEMV